MHYRKSLIDRTRREQLRREIDRQVQDYLRRGGEIEKLQSPRFQPHRIVRANALVAVDQL